MDKSSGNSDSRDMTLGCGPSTSATSLSTALSSSSSSSSTTATSSSSSSSSPPSSGASSPAPSSSANLGTTLPPPPPPPPITLNISTTTGGNFTVVVDVSNSVESLKKIIAKKLKVAKDRICLLHREKELHDGTVKDNGLVDGSKIILIPNVETGLLAQRPENTVMQALESLNDSQVNDFLSGKTPLNLSMRLGDHMMLIQLQLSTVNPSSPSSSSTSRSRSSQRSNRSSTNNQTQSTPLNSSSNTTTTTTSNNVNSHTHHHHHSSASRKLDVDATTATVSTATNTVGLDSNAVSGPTNNTASRMVTSNLQQSASTLSHSQIRTPGGRDLTSFLTKRDFESLQNIVKSISMAQQQPSSIPQAVISTSANTSSASMEVVNGTSGAVVEKKAANCCAPVASTSYGLMEQSPIKSLSNLVSSPIKTTSIKNIPISSNPKYTSELPNGSSSQSVAAGSATCSDPISAKLTSCLCTRLNNSSKSCEVNPCQSRSEVSSAEFATERTLVTSTPNYKLNSTGGSSQSVSPSPASVPSAALLHKTANNPIVRSKHRHHHHHHHHHHHYHHHAGNGSSNTGTTTGSGTVRKSLPAEDTNASDEKNGSVSDANDSALSLSTTSTTSSQENSNNSSTTSSSSTGSSVNDSTTSPIELDDSGITVTDTRTLAEASRNLTQTLRKLSKEVFTNKIDLSNEEIAKRSSSGAVIESMKNHGKGIYSGTFSGTLNPALQDRYGRPKRDISTVIHILNDLLSATPQYSRGARISFEAPSTSSSRSKQPSSSKPQPVPVSPESTCLKCSGNSTCVYGECTGHYSTKTLTTPNSCSDTEKLSSMCECTDLSPSTSSGAPCPNIDCTDADERNLCKCRYLFPGGRQRGQMCLKCATDMVNNKTKFKLDQLRLVMQQRKQKREARKLKGAPYGARVVTTSPSAAGAATSTASATASTIAPLASPSEVSPNHIVEEVDTAA